MRLPAIVDCNAWTLPQGRYNAAWVRGQGVGIVLDNLRLVDSAVDQLLDPVAYARFRAATEPNKTAGFRDTGNAGAGDGGKRDAHCRRSLKTGSGIIGTEPMTDTIHVFPSERGWVVKGAGSVKAGAFFSTQKEALFHARTIVRKRASGQIVVHGKNGRIAVSEVRGLPKIQESPVKSSLGTKNIERAVSKLVLERLASA
jgi:hypothetical protein